MRRLLITIAISLAVGKLTMGLSNRGKQFYLGFPENRILAEYPVVRLYMTTLSPTPVQVTIQMPFITDMESLVNGISLTIQPRETLVKEFNYNVHVEGSVFADKGMIVEANEDISIQVGQLNDLSSDTYLAFPTDSLGTEYHILTYIFTQQSSYPQGPTQILIVGIAEESSLNIILPHVAADTVSDLINMGVNCDDNVCTTTLLWCQTLQIQSKQDLTGTHITSDQTISVFASTVWTSVKSEYMGDHMVEQVPPSFTWGGEFILLPTTNRTSGDVIRILARENETSIVMKSYSTGTELVIVEVLNEGNYYDTELPTASVMHIISSKAILVAQFSMSNGADDSKLSDPFMCYIPSTAQYSSTVTFSDVASLVNPFYNNIAMVTNAKDINNIFINDKVITTYTYGNWIDVPSTNFKVNTVYLPYQIDNKVSTFYEITIKESGSIVGGLFYGLKVQESFGNVLGQEMNHLLIQCHNRTMGWEDAFDNDCDGLADEEIANGIDDDNDGIIDEDVFNEKMNRQQYQQLMKDLSKMTSEKQNIETTTGQPSFKATTEQLFNDQTTSLSAIEKISTQNFDDNVTSDNLLKYDTSETTEVVSPSQLIHSTHENGLLATSNKPYSTIEQTEAYSTVDSNNKRSTLVEHTTSLNLETTQLKHHGETSLSTDKFPGSTRVFSSLFHLHHESTTSNSKILYTSTGIGVSTPSFTTVSYLPEDSTINSDTNMTTETPFKEHKLTGKTKKVSYFDNMLIIIPICVLLGIPLLCCLCVCTKTIIASGKKKEIKPEKRRTKNRNTRLNKKMKTANKEISSIIQKPLKAGLQIDCRNESSKPSTYQISDYSKTRMFTTSECKHFLDDEIKRKNQKSLKFIKAQKPNELSAK